MDDILVIGGGVVGLSLAYELSGHGLRVRLLERDRPGRAASWAGAGIVPDATETAGQHPHPLLAGLSRRLHPEWAARLREATGIDTGYVPCGGLYLATQSCEADALTRQAEDMLRVGVAVETVDLPSLGRLEPALARSGHPGETTIHAAVVSPGEAQIRNPRHLRALVAACIAGGVRIESGEAVHDFEIRDGRVHAVLGSSGRHTAAAICLTTGCWSQELARRLAVQIAVRPIRGQMVLLECEQDRLRHIVNVGARYLVPRPDGRLLVGSTEEDVGFDHDTTASGVSGLLRFALQLAPSLATATWQRCWAGLRPATSDGLPYLGRLPDLENAYLAAGHFRSGLQLSTGTAVVMSRLIRGVPTEIDLTPFRVNRNT